MRVHADKADSRHAMAICRRFDPSPMKCGFRRRIGSTNSGRGPINKRRLTWAGLQGRSRAPANSRLRGVAAWSVQRLERVADRGQKIDVILQV